MILYDVICDYHLYNVLVLFARSLTATCDACWPSSSRFETDCWDTLPRAPAPLIAAVAR